MNNWLVWLLSFILPRRMWYRNYYLRSKHWRGAEPEGIKWKKMIEKKWTCELCGVSAETKTGTLKSNVILDVHHLRYYRNGKSILWHERPEDLQVLCRTCHNKEH